MHGYLKDAMYIYTCIYMNMLKVKPNLQTILFFTLLLAFTKSFAQPAPTLYSKPYSWMVGLSWTAVEDDGRGLCQTFDVAESWNFEFFPTRIFVDKYFKYGLSAEFSAAFVRYRPGKMVNRMNTVTGVFFNIDLNAKYSFYPIIRQKWIDPFVSVGIGVTQRTVMPQSASLQANVGLGVNFKIYAGLDFQLQTSAKFTFMGGAAAGGSFLQHQAGFLYKFNAARGSRHNFGSKRYHWTNKKVRYKGDKRGG